MRLPGVRRYRRAGPRRQLQANAWVVVVVAAQLERLAYEPCLTDDEAEVLNNAGRECRRIADDLLERAGHA